MTCVPKASSAFPGSLLLSLSRKTRADISPQMVSLVGMSADLLATHGRGVPPRLDLSHFRRMVSELDDKNLCAYHSGAEVLRLFCAHSETRDATIGPTELKRILHELEKPAIGGARSASAPPTRSTLDAVLSSSSSTDEQPDAWPRPIRPPAAARGTPRSGSSAAAAPSASRWLANETASRGFGTSDGGYVRSMAFGSNVRVTEVTDATRRLTWLSPPLS